MQQLSTTVVAVLAMTVSSSMAPAQDATWLTNWASARASAAKSNRVIAINFSGSDWCGWCVRLKSEVFDTAEFKRWAGKNVVLFEADFPHSGRQPAEVRAQNEELKRRYGVRGFPTIVFVDGNGRELGRVGYVEGGPSAWIRSAQRILSPTR
jgi:protein disulfide-isomerase